MIYLSLKDMTTPVSDDAFLLLEILIFQLFDRSILEFHRITFYNRILAKKIILLLQ